MALSGWASTSRVSYATDIPLVTHACQDVSMSSTTCAFCNRYSHMTPKWADVVGQEFRAGGGVVHESLIQGIATCDNCGRSSMGVSTSPGTGGQDARANFGRTSDESLTWYPRTGSSPAFEDVPNHIAAAATEAHSAASINAIMAAILMARTVVEATAKEKGITSGQLYAKIDSMEQAGLIRRSTAEAAHEIRHLGNDMAHGDIEDMPTADEADEVLVLMNEILSEVFQGPARTARIKVKRTQQS